MSLDSHLTYLVFLVLAGAVGLTLVQVLKTLVRIEAVMKDILTELQERRNPEKKERRSVPGGERQDTDPGTRRKHLTHEETR